MLYVYINFSIVNVISTQKGVELQEERKTLSTYLALLAKEASLLHIAMGTEYPTALRLHQGL